MPEHAHVSSIEAIEAFRAALVLYINRVRPALEEVTDQVTRTRLWLENDKRLYWENQVRKRAKALEQAQQALFSSSMSPLKASTSAEQLALTRARQALTEAELRLNKVKQWARQFDTMVEPLAHQLDHLQNFISRDLALAAGRLAEIVKTLEAYAEMTPPPASAPTSENPSAGDGSSSNSQPQS